MRSLVCAAALVLLLLAGNALAENIKPVVYGGGGLSLPIKPIEFEELSPLSIGIGDMYKMWAGFQGGAGIRVGPNFELIGWVTYNSFAFDDQGFGDAFVREFEEAIGIGGFDVDVKTEGGTLSLLGFMGEGKFLIPLGRGEFPVRPYLLGGLGLTRAKIEDVKMTATVHVLFVDTTVTYSLPGVTVTKFTFGAGAGVEWMVTSTVGVFVEGSYAQVAVSGDPIGYLPLRGGIKLILGK